MVHATDLRIGNWIQIGGNSVQDGSYQTYKPYQVTVDILADIKEENDERGEYILSVYQPIKLTDEWLLKFGAEKLAIYGYVVSDAVYWRINKIIFYEKDGMYCLKVGENISSIPGDMYIHFDKVHAFQNIFNLTGTELTINQSQTT